MSLLLSPQQSFNIIQNNFFVKVEVEDVAGADKENDDDIRGDSQQTREKTEL